ncbi:MAG: RNA polymerase sigma factor [Cyclobacteriaceae bacterium]
MPGQEENDLIEEILKGNSHAFAELVDKYEVQVFNFAMYILKNREEAEETTQDTFVNAYRSLKTFRHEAKFSTWLLRIAYNNSYTRLRKRKLTLVDVDAKGVHQSIPGANNIGEETDLQDVRTLLNLALEALTEDEKTLVTLYYYNEQSVKEICKITGKNLSNVKVVLHRSRQKMLKKLNEVGIKEWTI